MVASPIAKRVAKGRRLAFLGLASANVALVLALAGPLGALGDVVAPLTGHLVGIGLTASLALLVRRAVPLILAAGGLLTPPTVRPARPSRWRISSGPKWEKR